MPIPDYQKLMLPLLKLAQDKQEHSLRAAIDAIARELSLSEADLKELLPSGKQPVFENRVGWARTYLKKAGLLESTRRGYFRITDRGLELLKSSPTTVTTKSLYQFPEFKEFQTKSNKIDEGAISDSTYSGTPEELLEDSYQPSGTTLRRSCCKKLKNAPLFSLKS
jgi:restriction system protein